MNEGLKIMYVQYTYLLVYTVEKNNAIKKKMVLKNILSKKEYLPSFRICVG